MVGPWRKVSGWGARYQVGPWSTAYRAVSIMCSKQLGFVPSAASLGRMLTVGHALVTLGPADDPGLAKFLVLWGTMVGVGDSSLWRKVDSVVVEKKSLPVSFWKNLNSTIWVTVGIHEIEEWKPWLSISLKHWDPNQFLLTWEINKMWCHSCSSLIGQFLYALFIVWWPRHVCAYLGDLFLVYFCEFL